MSVVSPLIDIILHIDTYLVQLVDAFGALTYVILFAIVLLETGAVAAPFLPGDSLLIASGALAAQDSLRVDILIVTLIFAAIIGDSVNYWIGSIAGPKIFEIQNSRLFKKEYLEKAHAFYLKHGGKTIVLARFIPIVRTFAPFVAGVAKMEYRRFALFNVSGAVAWVVILTYGGYLFGGIPIIRDNFSIVILAVIVLSLIPPAIELIRAKLYKSEEAD